MNSNISFGKKGEELAKKYLMKHSYKILHCNWRYMHKEIDIITRKDDTIVFVEVKIRKNDVFENPKEAVTKKKQKLIIEAANAYIEKFNIDLEARFDIVSIVFSNREPEIEHIEDAFYPIV